MMDANTNQLNSQKNVADDIINLNNLLNYYKGRVEYLEEELYRSRGYV